MRPTIKLLYRFGFWAVFSLLFLAVGHAEDEKLSLNLESAPIRTVLDMISDQHGLNIVVNSTIEGDVTLRLSDVPLNIALAAILNPNGYNYYYDGDVIVVKSYENTTAAELTSRLLRLNYANAVAVKKALEAVKSDKGSIVVLDPTVEGVGASGSKYTPNQLLVSDYAANVAQMIALMSDLDQPEKIVSIEVKIIETTIDNQHKVGFTWPESITSKISTPLSTGTSSTGAVDQTTNVLGSQDLNGGRWTWGTLSVNELKVVLEALDENGNSRLLSDPKISTAENYEAEIKSQTVIPIQTINRFTESAATADIVSFVDEEVGISLKVTPRINDDNRITLEVMPVVQDIIGYVGTSENRKPITSERSVKTRITVSDGETAALGGLLKETEIVKERKVPLLGQIPILGPALFSRKESSKTTTDLLILITPHLMQ